MPVVQGGSLIALTVLSETTKTLTVGWTPVVGAAGYEFLVDGKRVSNTWDATVKQVKFGKPDAGEHTYSVIVLGKTDEGDLVWPAVNPPPSGWVVAPPVPPVTNLSNPTGPAINAHSASDPMTYHDTIIQGGGDSAILIQPGAPGRTFNRIQALNVAAANAQSYGKHAIYGKAKGLRVNDFYATSSKYAASGLSVRYGDWQAQRFQLDGFYIGISYYEEEAYDEPVVFTEGIVNHTNTGVWLSVDAGTRVTPDFTFQGVQFTGPPLVFAAQAGIMDGTLTSDQCVWRAKAGDKFVPVTAAMCKGIPAGQLHIS